MKKKKLNKYFVATLASTVAASSTGVVAPPTADAAKSFPDVKSSDYFYQAVSNLAERGVINGFKDGNFKPYENVTRGQAAVIIAGALGLDTINVKNPNFKDVTTKHPYYGAIAALANKGYINGFEDGTFGSSKPITRNHMAIIIAKAFNLQTTSNQPAPFTDMYPDYKGFITALYENGVTSGTTKSTFGGASNVTRGQLAQFVVNAEKAKNAKNANHVEESFTVNSVSDLAIKTSKGELKIASSLKSIFASTNVDALKEAEVKAVIEDDEVKSISSITLNTAGTADKAVVFDGGKSTITGNVKVNADYVAVNNVTVNGDVTLTSKVVNEFAAEGLIAKGELVIDEASPVATAVASLTNVAAETANGPKINLKGSNVNSVHAKRDNVAISSDKKLPEVKVSAKVTAIEVNADVEKVTINVTVKLEITGKGSIDEVAVEKAVELALKVAGQVKELVVDNKDTKVEVGVSVAIDKLVVPAGSDVASVVKNYNSVKDKIKDVKEDKGSEVKPGNGNNTGGSSGGSSSGSSGGSSGGNNNNKNFSLSIMHTNDTHANLDNVAKTVTAVKEVRSQKPDALLLNAGDVFSGTLYFNEFQGKADLAFMNLMKYDAMTFGNHEFDLGKSGEGHQALAEFIAGSKFPFISANVNFSADEKFQGLFSDLISSEPENGKIYNGIIKEINGEKVGIFGLTTAETKNLSSPEKITFEDYKTEAEKAVKAFEDKGIDKIIAITHIGYDDNAAVDNDLTLAAEVEGIDVIVGGHSHTELKSPVVVDREKTPTIIVQSGANNTNLGVLDVEFDKNGKVVNHDGKLIKINETQKDKDGKDLKDENGKVLYVHPEDAEAKEILADYKAQVEKLAKEEIGVSTETKLENPRTNGDNTKPSVRKNETILGNLITDGMLKKAKDFTGENVVMAFQNGGGIRAAIDAGPITVGEVITVLPFGNTLAVMDVTGAELKEAFEISVGNYPAENGGFLHVAGAKVEYDSSKPGYKVDDKGVVLEKGQRVVSIKYKNQEGDFVEIKDDDIYTIATNAFTAQGGDGYTPFAKAYSEGRVKDLGLSDWENFREHLQGIETIPTETEGRIVDVADKEEGSINENPGTSPAPTNPTAPTLLNTNPEKLSVTQVGRYDSGQGEIGTEIMAYDSSQKLAFVTNGAVNGFDIMSFEDLKTGEYTAIESTKRVVLANYGIQDVTNITSIAAHPTEDLIAIAAYGEKTEKGYVVFATKDGKYVKHVQVGYLPDSLEFTPNGTQLVVANEGEPNDDTTIDPEGSISIIDVETFEHTNLTFTENMLDEKVRMSYKGMGSSYLEQLEPEFVTISSDSKTVYVSLQENNSIATIDLTSKTIKSVEGLGVLDHSVAGYEMDANKDDKEANILKAPILTFHMPDAIDTFTIDGTTYIITPNEGDSRDYTGYSEVLDLKELVPINLKADRYKGYTQEELNAFDLSSIEGYKVTTENGKNAEGKYEAIYGYGGRSFSIFNAATMERVFDSGNEFETIIKDQTPTLFNINNDNIKADNRSDDKGPEPESAVVGVVDGTTYGFIGLERYSAIMVYDLTNPEEPQFVTMISSRDFTKDVAGDVSPEGLKFIPAAQSPTGKAILVATHEVSGTIAVYELGKGVTTKEVSPEAFSGTVETPNVIEGNVKVNVENAIQLQNAVIKGNLILEGTPSENFNIQNVTVEGDADLSGLEGINYTFDGLEVTGETIL